MGKKRNQNKSEESDSVDQHQDVSNETPDTPEEVPAAAEVNNKKQEASPAAAAEATPPTKGSAQKTVDAAVTVAKDAVKATVEQIKTQIGEENTQKAIDFANKAKSEVTEVVDYAKETVEDAANKAKAKATAKVTEVKDKTTAKVNEVKDMATAKAVDMKDKATAKAVDMKDKASAKTNETVDNLKHNEKVQGAAKKADDATRWLKGEVAESSLENTTVNVTSIVIASALAASSAALGIVGLNKPVSTAVTSVRNGVTGIATKTQLVKSVHTFANQYWPYQLAARMVVHVDASVMQRLSKANGDNTNTIPTPTKAPAPAISEKTPSTTA